MTAPRGKILVIFSILETLIFSGIIFGWSSFVFVLKLDGIYKNLCNYSTSLNKTQQKNGICEDQDNRLNLFYSISVATALCMSCTSGVILSKWGVTVNRITFIIMYMCGLLCLGFTNTELPWLFLPGLICVGTSGLALFMNTMQIAVLLKSGPKIYTAIINGSFASSAFTMLIVKILIEVGAKRYQVFLVLTVTFLVISVTCTILQNKEDNEWVQQQKKCAEITVTTISGSINISEDVGTIQTDNKTPLRQLLRSCSLLLQSFWIVVMVLRSVFYQGSVNYRFEIVLVKESRVSQYTNFLAYFTFSGLVTSTAVGGFQEWQKYIFKDCKTKNQRTYFPLVATFTISSMLAMLLSLFGIIQSETTLYPEFVVYVLFRSYYDSSAMFWTVAVCPKKWSNLVYGLFMFLCAVTSPLQYILFSWIQEVINAFVYVNYIFVASSALTIATSVQIFHQGQKHQ